MVTSRNVDGLRKQGVLVMPPTTGAEVATLQPSFGAMPKPKAIVEYLLRERRVRATAEYRAFSADVARKEIRHD